MSDIHSHSTPPSPASIPPHATPIDDTDELDSSDIYYLQLKVKEFCEARNWDPHHNAKDLAIGITTESSELLEHFRFIKESQIPKHFESKRWDIEDEVADIFFVLLRFCQKHHIDLKKALERKMKKNAKKYPVDLKS